MDRIVITDQIMQEESLQEWADSFKLGSSGYQNTLDPEDFNDPAVPFNRIKMSLVAEARARVLKRELGEEGLSLHVGGEVRFHTGELINLFSRIYAGHGIKVRRRLHGKSTPIWYSSFGIFYEELTGGENFTASQSAFFKGGWKPMDGKGSQLFETVGLIEEEIREITKVGTTITLAPPDSDLIHDDFDVTEPYTEYLKSLVDKKGVAAINEAAQKGFNAFFASVGGSMEATASHIIKKMGIAVGDGEPVNFIFDEEDPMYHNIGIVDGVNYGVDPGKWQVYKNIGAQNILANRQANVVFLWDPDGGRFNMISRAPSSLSKKASEMGLEVEPLPGDPNNVCVFYSPNQVYFMLTASLLEALKEKGQLEDLDWIIVQSFQTSRSMAELGKKFGVKVFFTPVGFKHFGKTVAEIEKNLEQSEEDEVVTIEDIHGQEHDLGVNPRILIMVEETGGAAFGGANFLRSRSGTKQSLAPKENDGLQSGFQALVLAAELFNRYSCFASYYLATMEKYDIINRFSHREDLPLYDESIQDPCELEKAKVEGLKKRDSILAFFKGLADEVRNGRLGAEEVSKALNSKQSFLEFEPASQIFWTGDGTFLEFSDFWFGVRASSTDPILKYYMEGSDKYFLKKLSRALISIE